jgi:hypothetical protein
MAYLSQEINVKQNRVYDEGVLAMKILWEKKYSI